MAESLYQNCGETIDWTTDAAYDAGAIVQLPDGTAGQITVDAAASTLVGVRVRGVLASVTKTASQVWLAGAPLWWDHSANAATCIPPLVTGDRDFFLGCATADATSAATTGGVHLNRQPSYVVDFLRDGGDTAVVLTAGTPYIYNRGGSMEAGFSATAEAQKLDWLSKRSFAIASNWILEAVVEVVTNCDADVGDLTIGVANGTHASDFQSVTEFATFHFDMGADLNLDAESDDGTTDVDPTDTTVDWAVGTPLYLVIDGRDHTDIQYYVNGVNVLPATTFTLTAATGPLKAIFHLEKSSNDSPGVVQLDMLRVRTQQ